MSLGKDIGIAVSLILGGAILIAIFIAIGAILNGWVLSILWGWFIVPTLGFPKISLVPAIGLALVVSFLTYQYVDAKPAEEKESIKIIKLFLLSVIRLFIALLFGWIIYLFM